MRVLKSIEVSKSQQHNILLPNEAQTRLEESYEQLFSVWTAPFFFEKYIIQKILGVTSVEQHAGSIVGAHTHKPMRTRATAVCLP